MPSTNGFIVSLKISADALCDNENVASLKRTGGSLNSAS